MRLVAFDFDGTLSEAELVVRLGEQADCVDEITSITDRAMAGDLGYAESLRRRVSLLEGLTVAEVQAAYESVTLRSGAPELLRDIGAGGAMTAIITGGFEEGVVDVLDRAGVRVDAVVANRLVVRDGRLTGEVEGPLVDDTKDAALEILADRYGVDPGDTIAVGDGANDVPMLEAAGFAIGFCPKPAVGEHCDVVVESMAVLGRTLAEVLGR